MNLFLCGCVYNHHLRKAYGLGRIERWLEAPLDSVVAKAIDQKWCGEKLPTWRGLKHLRPDDNEKYQRAAQQLARSIGLRARIFLENELWLRNR